MRVFGGAYASDEYNQYLASISLGAVAVPTGTVFISSLVLLPFSHPVAHRELAPNLIQYRLCLGLTLLEQGIEVALLGCEVRTHILWIDQSKFGGFAQYAPCRSFRKFATHGKPGIIAGQVIQRIAGKFIVLCLFPLPILQAFPEMADGQIEALFRGPFGSQI